MFKHEKMFFHPVSVEKQNPQYAVLLQEQLGGGNGELKAGFRHNQSSQNVFFYVRPRTQRVCSERNNPTKIQQRIKVTKKKGRTTPS